MNKMKYKYAIKSCPSGDNDALESLLNSMAEEGYELYSMQEIAGEDDEPYYNCIFIKEYSQDDNVDESLDILGFKSKMERIMNQQLEPYEQCLDIQKKISDKKVKIAQVKLLLDSTSEDSRSMLNEEISKNMKELDELKSKLAEVVSPDIMQNKLGEVRLGISISEELFEILSPDSEINLIAEIVAIRQNLTERLGYIIPKVIVNVDDSLQPNEFSINIRGIQVAKSFAYPGYSRFFADELNMDEYPDSAIKDIDCITERNTVWIEEEQAKDYWVKGNNATEVIAKLLEHTAIKHIDEIFDYSDVNRYIDVVGKQNLYLIENILPDFLSVAELKYLLSSLIREQVSIKDINYIFEKINDFSDDTTKEALLSKLRIALGRQISRSVADDDGTIRAILLSENTLDMLMEKSDNPNVIHIESQKIEEIAQKIKDAAKNSNLDKHEILIVTSEETRHIIYLILSQLIPNLRVVAKEELLYDYPLNVLAEI